VHPETKTGQRKNNLVLFLISLVIAFGLWLQVQSMSNVQRLYTLPLRDTGLSEGLVLTSRIPRMVSVEAQGSKEDLDIVDQQLRNLDAFIDLSSATVENNPNAVPVELNLPGVPSGIRWIVRQPRIAVEVQPRMKVTRPVEVDLVGSPEDGWSVVDPRADPNSVDLYGLGPDIEKVAKVQALLNLSEAKRGEPTAVALRLLDAQGREVDGRIIIDPDRVLVRATYIPEAPKRYLPIVLTWSGQLPTGYRFFRNHALSPSQLQVTGDTETLGKVTALETEPINLSDLRGTKTLRVKVKVPRGVKLLTPNTVVVTVFVEPVAETPPQTTGNGAPP
jgi:YbbR domain-containing protein